MFVLQRTAGLCKRPVHVLFDNLTAAPNKATMGLSMVDSNSVRVISRTDSGESLLRGALSQEGQKGFTMKITATTTAKEYHATIFQEAKDRNVKALKDAKEKCTLSKKLGGVIHADYARKLNSAMRREKVLENHTEETFAIEDSNKSAIRRVRVIEKDDVTQGFMRERFGQLKAKLNRAQNRALLEWTNEQGREEVYINRYDVEPIGKGKFVIGKGENALKIAFTPVKAGKKALKVSIIED